MNELRFGPDRRRFARGGRRAHDPAGYAPMVVVIDNDATRLDLAEAILAKLRFAVAPFATVEKAIAAMHALMPEVVVVRADAVRELRDRLPVDRDGRAIPLLPLTAELADPSALVEALRQVIRQNRAQIA
jgi:FixJ family two-component response regulator